MIVPWRKSEKSLIDKSAEEGNADGYGDYPVGAGPSQQDGYR